MPLLSKVRGVHQAFTIGRKIRTRLPGGFFIMNFMCFGAGLRLHPPESASAVDVAAVGNEENLITIARPDWTDFVIELAVVITWQIAGSLSSQALHVPEFTTAEIGDENMKMSLVQRGDKRHAFAVG